MIFKRIIEKVVLACAFVGALALAGCGGSSSTAPAASTTATTTVAATVAGTSSASTSTTPGGVATVTVPQATILYDSNGAPVTGTVTISTTAVTSAASLSSGALAATLSDGSGLVLDSVAAIAEISMTSGGSTVKTFSTPIKVNLKLPVSYLAGSSVDYYSFDGISTWTKEGTAVVNIDHSIDMFVTHLSHWGAITSKVPAGSVSWTSVINDSITGSLLQDVNVSTTLLSKVLTAKTNANGSFTFTSLPANTSFGVKLSKAGYADIYSARLSLAGNSDSSGKPYSMFTPAQLTTWGNTAGKGIIRSRVMDANYVPIQGAVVTAIDAQNNTSYPVTYNDAGTNTTSTDTSGRYVVLNVPAGRTVNVTASRMGYIFTPRVFDVKADSLSQSSINGSLGMTESMISGKTFAFSYTYNNSSGIATLNANHTISIAGSSITGTWAVISPTQMITTLNTSLTNVETDTFTLTSATPTTFTGTQTWVNSSNSNSGSGTMTFTLQN